MGSIRYIYILPFLFALSVIGCKPKQAEIVPHTGYADSVLATKRFGPKDSVLFKHYVDSAYQALPKKTIGDDWYRHRYMMMFWYYTGRIAEKSLQYADSMLLVIQPQKNDPAYLDLYLQTILFRGDVLLALAHFEEAFSSYYEAQEIGINKKDTCAYFDQSNRLARVFFEQKKFADAAIYYKQAFNDLEHCRQDTYLRLSNQQGALDNAGIAYSRMRQDDSAGVYFNRALEYIREIEIQCPDKKNEILTGKAVVFGNLADIEIRQGRTAHAEKLLLDAIHINLDPERAPEDATYSMIKLVGLYIDLGRIKEAGDMMTQLSELEKEFVNMELHIRYLEQRARYEIAVGDSKTAYKFMQERARLRDSIDRVSSTTPSTDIHRAFEHIGNEYRLKFLEAENQRKTEYLVITIVFSIMIFVIVVLLWKNYRRTNQTMRSLHVLNKEIVQKNEHLLNMLEALEQSHRDKRHLMHIVAHDLRTPVGSITMLSGLIEENQIEKEKVPEAIRLIAKSGASALTLINELLQDPAVVKEDKRELLDLAELLKYCVDVMQNKAAEKKQIILLEPQTAKLFGNRDKLLRIFHNLLYNAIKFSLHNTTTRITMQCSDTQVLVSVIDQGIGIPADFEESIFNPPASALRAGTEGEVSYGLGLSIVYQLVKEHKGLIWYSSEIGKGTTFYLELPLGQL